LVRERIAPSLENGALRCVRFDELLVVGREGREQLALELGLKSPEDLLFRRIFNGHLAGFVESREPLEEHERSARVSRRDTALSSASLIGLPHQSSPSSS
jgi:hypothetical protein